MATVGELLKAVAEKLGLQVDDHFLYFGGSSSSSGFIGNSNDKLSHLVRRASLFCLLSSVAK